MDVIRISGGRPLSGVVQVSGAKNAALPIFASTLLTDQPCIIKNVPDLSDIHYMAKILQHMGASVERLDDNSWKVEAKEITHRAPYELVRKMRASICILGPLIARLRRAEISLPGGCVIGQRPIDLHIKGLVRMGCTAETKSGYVHVDGKNLKGSHVFLGGRHGSTVLGTENIVMAAVLTPGETRIESAACEPEVVDLCNMLVAMGADIEGIGSHTLTIRGVESLHGCEYSVMPDRIEAGTFVIAGAVTRSNITIEGTDIYHLGALLDKMDEIGLPIHIPNRNTIEVKTPTNDISPTELITMAHPGFPTDLQAQMCALMALTPGLSIITERIYPNRFMHVPELQRMGANISMEGPSAIIHGIKRLSGAPVMASDLRASAALVLAGLAAEDETWIQRVYHIDRGYEKIEEKLSSLGADIERMSESAMPEECLVG